MNAAGAIARTAGVLGHELRNPLAAAVTGTALLREMIDADDPRRAVAEGVLRELDRLSGLIDGYLDLARCGKPRRLPVALRRLAATVAARHPGVVVDSGTEVLVQGDALLLERAVENLIENALHAGAAQVRLALRPRDQRIDLVVADDGPGIAPELRSGLFEAGVSRTGGTGLGLGIVAEVAAAHGGAVRCDPCSAGARFVLELPLAAAHAEA